MRKIVKAIYGTSNNYNDVLDIIMYLMKGNDMIKISNDFFGDPIPGILKRLQIQYDDETTVYYDENTIIKINLDAEYPISI